MTRIEKLLAGAQESIRAATGEVVTVKGLSDWYSENERHWKKVALFQKSGTCSVDNRRVEGTVYNQQLRINSAINMAGQAVRALTPRDDTQW